MARAWQSMAMAVTALGTAAVLGPVAAGDPLPQRQTREVPWAQAVAYMEACEVEMVIQTHQLEVYMNLRDGSRVRAREPLMDEVFRVLNRTRQECGTIPIATE